MLELTPEITLPTLQELLKVRSGCQLILWTNGIGGDFALQALTMGVRGVLRKNVPLEAHLQCLHKVYSGELWFEKGLTDSFRASRRVWLTRRESQLVTLLTRGLKNKEISRELGITEGTVKVYLSRLFQKSGASDRFELALQGLKNFNITGVPANGLSGLTTLVMEPACR